MSYLIKMRGATKNHLMASPGSSKTVCGKRIKTGEVMDELIEANSPGPYLELFSRVHRDNWTMLGDGIDGLDIRESINKQTKRTQT